MKTESITRITWAALVVLVMCGYSFAAQTIYVDADAAGTNDGSSWANAYNYLQDALADANSNSDVNEIRVARGIYKPDQGGGQTPGDREATFQLVDGVTLEGGYAGFGEPDPDARDIELYDTILSGDLAGNDIAVANPRDLLDEPARAENSYHVVTSSDVYYQAAVLDGFTITAGSGSYGGGGVNCYGSNPTVINCTFFANTAGWGGGMYIGGSSPKLSNCIFRANAAAGHAGALEVEGSYTQITNCTFIGNFAAWLGGAVWNFDAAPPYINCVFSGNVAGEYGGAIWNVDSGGYSFINCTFTNNTAGREGGAIFSNEWPNITNCILWGNRDSSGMGELVHVLTEAHGAPVFNYCCVQGWTGNLGGVGNTGEDPLFVEADGADNVPGTEDDNLRLLAGSACLDSGDNSALPPSVLTDLDGNPRIINGTVDMGAYEGLNQGFLLSTSSVNIPEGTTSEFSVALAMAPAGNVEVTVARQSGDTDITVISPTLLIFDSSNYSVPKAVNVAAAQDADYIHGKALISISAYGFVTAGVTAIELDDEAPEILYVDIDATGTGDGTSWANAFAHLQDALLVAGVVPEVEEIRVAQGTYTPDRGNGLKIGDRTESFVLINGLAIKGGYAGLGEPDPDARYITLYETILSGDLNGDDVEVTDPCDLSDEPSRAENSRHVVTSEQYTDKTAVLDGFTISGGNADNQEPGNLGGGMYNGWKSNPTLTNCIFSSNSARYGGGIYNDSWSSPKITNCTFSRNLAAGEYASGGGIYSYYDGSPVLTDCTFIGNCAKAVWNASGGGMWNGTGSPTLNRCKFSGNSALGNWGSGGALYNDSCISGLLNNCIFIGNYAGQAGGAMYNRGWYGSATMVNCTFSDNSAQYGRALACDSYHSPSNISINSSIIWDDSDEIWNNDDSTITVTYSNIQGGWPGEGNIDADPKFINPGSGDYHLFLGSPCIDTGDPNYIAGPNETDVSGNPRVFGGRVDMGAYESQGIQILYVDMAAPLGGDGKSWDTAFRYLQDALFNAEPPAEIRVALGIYKPHLNTYSTAPPSRTDTFQLRNGVTIKGGYAGIGAPDFVAVDPNIRDIEMFQTILSGDMNGDDIDVNEAWDVWREPSFVDNSYHVVTGSGTNSTAVLDGLTVTGGCASGPESYDNNDISISSGAGMLNDAGSPTVLNCTFRKNTTWTSYGVGSFDDGNFSLESTYIYLPGTSGAAVFNRDGSPTFNNCVFEENVCFGADASSAGAGVCNINSSPLLQKCVFRTNEVTGFDSECYGGAMANYISNPTLRDCLFVGNLAVFSFGGAIYNEESNPILENCTFRNNESGTSGGAIFVNGGNSTLMNCMFDENSAYMGGGICLGDGLATLTNCTFKDNSASDGGGLYSDFRNSLTLKDCTFISNRADSYGGAIENSGAWYNDPNSVTLIENCLFTANSSYLGGGVHNGWNRKNLTVVNCIFSGNEADIAGGGIYNYGCEQILSNCTFAGNSASEGDALASDLLYWQETPSNLQISNCIFWNGENGILNSENTIVAITYSDVEGGWPGEGNIDADPCFVEPGYWDPNGTPADANDDFWVDGDYHLLLDSPCIDTGDNTAVPPSVLTDLDGKPRIIGDIVDMGAYEFCGPIYVDDDGPNDPGPGDPQVSDPLENGTNTHPFDTIQEGINVAKDGYTVLVRPGSYLEPASGNSIDFPGKNITLASEDPTDWDIVDNTVIRGYVQFSGTEGPNCKFAGFRISNLEGAIYGNHTHAAISHCNISGNGPCGATVIKDCDGIISNCLITDNTTFALCGIYPVVFGCNGLIKNCTIANNESGLSVGTATIENCIIYNNYGSQLGVGSSETLNISYCNLQGGLEGITGEGSVNWGPGNIDTDPCFVRLGYWIIDDATLIEGDYHLKSEGHYWSKDISKWIYDDYVTSRCVDAGNPGSLLRDELMSVPRDPNNVWGVNLRINMGAYGGTGQAGMPPYDWALLADLNNDGIVNFLDFAYQTLDWLKTAPEQPGDLNRDGVLNTMDLALLAEEWLQTTEWANQPPVVYITQPPDGLEFCWLTESVLIEANVRDFDGTITSVEFFINGEKVGEDNDGTDGWMCVTSFNIGTYTLIAKATDDKGVSTISPPVTITAVECQ